MSISPTCETFKIRNDISQQNSLVSHNYLSLVAYTCRVLFGLEKGTWGRRWDAVAGGPGSAPVLVQLSELHRTVLLHFSHFNLLIAPQTPWGPGT